MSSTDFIISLILLALSSYLLFFLGKILVSRLLVFSSSKAANSGSSKKGGKKKEKVFSGLRKLAPKAKKAEKLIEEKKYGPALKELKKSLALDVKPEKNGIADVLEHNQMVLSLILQLAEIQNIRLKNLGIVEQLLNERGEGELELVKAELAYQKLIARRSESGKETPSWGKKEFKQNISDLKDARDGNLKSLKKQLSILFDSFKKSDAQEVTYH